MKQFEKDFERKYRALLIQVKAPRVEKLQFDSFDSYEASTSHLVDNFLKNVLHKDEDIFRHLEIEDVHEKAGSLKADMRILCYLLHHQPQLTNQLTSITSKLMAEYENEMALIRTTPISDSYFSIGQYGIGW